MTSDANAVIEAIRRRYPPPDYLIATEVEVQDRERRLDVVALDVRPGPHTLTALGFEVKVSRSDWLNEVRKPKKMLAARAVCDFFFVVEGSLGCVLRDELPVGVGLKRVVDSKLDDVFPAAVPNKAMALDRLFVSAVLRRVQAEDGFHPRSYWEGREKAARGAGYAQGRNAQRRAKTFSRLQGKTVEPEVGPDGNFCA